MNPAFKHKDTKNTKQAGEIDFRNLFVPLCFGGEFPCRFWVEEAC